METNLFAQYLSMNTNK